MTKLILVLFLTFELRKSAIYRYWGFSFWFGAYGIEEGQMHLIGPNAIYLLRGFSVSFYQGRIFLKFYFYHYSKDFLQDLVIVSYKKDFSFDFSVEENQRSSSLFEIGVRRWTLKIEVVE